MLQAEARTSLQMEIPHWANSCLHHRQPTTGVPSFTKYLLSIYCVLGI